MRRTQIYTQSRMCHVWLIPVPLYFVIIKCTQGLILYIPSYLILLSTTRIFVKNVKIIASPYIWFNWSHWNSLMLKHGKYFFFLSTPHLENAMRGICVLTLGGCKEEETSPSDGKRHGMEKDMTLQSTI